MSANLRQKLKIPLMKIISSAFPKKNKIVFISHPDFADNTRFLYEYIKNLGINYELIWISKNPLVNVKLAERGIKVAATRAEIYKNLITAKVVVTTSMQYLDTIQRNQIYVSLWHGMPLKKMAFRDKLEKHTYIIKAKGDHITFQISTSELMSSLLTACFHLYPEQVIITGQPRCDALFHPKKDVLGKLLGVNIEKFEHIVFYMPTFRNWMNERVEGIEIKDNIFRFKNFDAKRFHEFLKKHGILFVAKLHWTEEPLYYAIDKKFTGENFRIIRNDALSRNLVDIYELLGAADLLITDYSSVYFDFLLLDKPIVFVPVDIDIYRMKRGFLLEPYDFWTPGPKAYDQESLEEEMLKSLQDKSYYSKQRETINALVNNFRDDRSTERVWNEIRRRLEELR